MSQQCRRTFTENSSVHVDVSAIFSTSVSCLTFLGTLANSDPLGCAVLGEEAGELSTVAGLENSKETKEQTSKPMTKKRLIKKDILAIWS